jgi:hypothetical protein
MTSRAENAGCGSSAGFRHTKPGRLPDCCARQLSYGRETIPISWVDLAALWRKLPAGAPLIIGSGGMAERLKAAVLKTVSGVTHSGVRIPLPPPDTKTRRFPAIPRVAKNGAPSGRFGAKLEDPKARETCRTSLERSIKAPPAPGFWFSTAPGESSPAHRKSTSRSIRSPAGWSTIPRRSGSARGKSSPRPWSSAACGPPTWRRWASPTSAKPRFCGIARPVSPWPTPWSGRIRAWRTTFPNSRARAVPTASAPRPDCRWPPISAA